MEKKFSKGTAVVLTLFLGGIGIHKFYFGQSGQGILFLVFCWTGIPAIFALVDLIKICMDKYTINNQIVNWN